MYIKKNKFAVRRWESLKVSICSQATEQSEKVERELKSLDDTEDQVDSG